MSDYIECPQCRMKYHAKAGSCPRCKQTPEQIRDHQHKVEEAGEKLRLQTLEREQARMEKDSWYCPACGTLTTNPKKVAPGSTGIELLLWLFFIVPGLFYSLWRISNKRRICRVCGSDPMIPATSPRARSELHRIAPG